MRVALALVVAALVAWLVWSRLGGDDSAAPSTMGGATTDAAPEWPGAGDDDGAAAAGATTGADAGNGALVPLDGMVRAQIYYDFARTKLSAEDREALARGDVPDVVARLYARTDGDATAALARLWSICIIKPGRVDLGRQELSQWMPERVSAEVAARVDTSIEQQRQWSDRFARGCETAGFSRGTTGARDSASRARIMDRLRTCADAGHADCLATLAQWDDADPKSTSRLQSAALLGSIDAQYLLLMRLESAPNANTEAIQASIRYWRQALAKSDPEYRAAFGSCTDPACDPAARDVQTVRADLEAAAREGSLYALATLGGVDAGDDGGMSSADMDFAPPGATVKPAYVNTSEVDAYAWKSLLEKLALQGCLGFWPNWATYVGSREEAERKLRPAQLSEASALASRYYDEYGAKVAATRGCSAQ